MNPSKIRNRL